MAKTYILHNPHAGPGGQSEINAEALAQGGDVELLCVTKITNYAAFLEGMEPGDRIILAGGDGTLNRFVNDTAGVNTHAEIFYYPSGSGNDFAHDLGKEKFCQPFSIDRYLRDLPQVTVKGKTYRFLNGVGYGIDGYCCEVGDAMRKIPGKKVDYTMIAIKGLLFHFQPRNATVTVDGVSRSFRKVWIAPTMHGRFYGGGMMPTPNQDRNAGGKLSAMVFHDSGKLKTLMIFPSLFKGEHVKHTKHVAILEGQEITVEFDRPTALQIDGETILGVTSYTAKTAAKCREETSIRGVAVGV